MKVTIVIFFVVLAFLGFYFYQTDTAESEQTEPVLSEPVMRAESRPQASASATETTEHVPSIAVEGEGIVKVIETDQVLSVTDYLKSDGNKRVLETQVLSDLTVQELRNQIQNMELTGQQGITAVNTEQKLVELLQKNDSVVADTVKCSDSLCGIILSGYEENSVSAAIGELARNPDINEVASGGHLQTIDEGGIQYGVLILALGKGQKFSVK